VSREEPIVLDSGYLAVDVGDLAWAWVRRELGLGPGDPPLSVFSNDVPVERQREVRLKMLAVLEQISTALDGQARHVASAAAKAGADYSDLGDAVGMTRQGARRRWPALAEVTRAAREQQSALGRAEAGPPSFRFDLYVPDAAAGAIVGHLVAAGHTGREVVQGAAGVHIGLPDRAAAETLRERLAAAGYRPQEVTEP
jgi:hypothetical protein